MSRIVAIMGSPRTQGNTDTLLDAFLKGVKERGGRVTKYVLRDLQIAPCMDCRRCLQEGRCVIRDDGERIYRDLLQSDLVVVGSPLYFLSVSAQTKALIDRAQAIWLQKGSRTASSCRMGVFLSTAGRPGADFSGAIKVVRAFFRVLSIEYKAEILVPGTDKCPVSQHYLLRAFNLGKELAAQAGRDRT